MPVVADQSFNFRMNRLPYRKCGCCVRADGAGKEKEKAAEKDKGKGPAITPSNAEKVGQN